MQLLKPELTSYFGYCFESLCREALPDLYRREGVCATFQVGEYWDKSTQIDVVGLRDDNWTDLGECKWGSLGSLSKLAESMAAKVQAYPNRRNATIARRLFLQRSERKAGPRDVQVHDLADLYEEERRSSAQPNT